MDSFLPMIHIFLSRYQCYLIEKSREVNKNMVKALYDITKYILGNDIGKQFFVIFLQKYYDLKNKITVDEFESTPVVKTRINIYDTICIFKEIGLISGDIDEHEFDKDIIYLFDIKIRFLILFYLHFNFIREVDFIYDEFLSPLNQAIYEVLIDGKCITCKKPWVDNICSCGAHFHPPEFIKTKIEYLI